MAISHDQYARIKAELLAPGGPNANPADPWTDSHFSLMDELEGFDLADCILQATIRGQERLVRTLMERRGPVPIVVGKRPNVAGRYTLNGRYMTSKADESMFAIGIRTPANLKSLLSMIVEFDMKGLIEAGQSFPLLLKSVERNSFLKKNNVSRFEGVLPELVDGVLGHPELALALMDESLRTSTPEAYKPMLCWASEDMVRQFPKNLSPLLPYQLVDGRPMPEWKLDSGKPKNMSFKYIVLGVSPSKACSEVVEYLHQTMTPMSAKLGFQHDRGRVLCETTADFLLQFQAGGCTDENLQAAFDFTANYCPIEIIAAQAVVTCRQDFGVVEVRRVPKPCFEIKMEFRFDHLFGALGHGHALRERVMDLMTRDQWSSLLKKARVVSTDSLVGLYQAFGIDNRGTLLDFSFGDFEVLVQGGYRFADGTKVYEHPAQHQRKKGQKAPIAVVHLEFTGPSLTLAAVDTSHQDLHSFMVNVYKNVLKTNLWPANTPAPESIAGALEMASRILLGQNAPTKALALEAYLANAGLDACIEVVKTPSQWVALTQVFSGDELAPYLKIMPKKAKGRMLELGLGL